MSARMFAAFTLMEEMNSDNTSAKRSRRATSKSNKSPLIPLLQTYVNVECKSLGDCSSNNKGSALHKKVQFTGFDDSSTKPPRDSCLGSFQDRHKTILAMGKVLDQINTILQTSSKDQRETVVNQLIALQQFLLKLQTPSNDVGASIRYQCGKVR